MTTPAWTMVNLGFSGKSILGKLHCLPGRGLAPQSGSNMARRRAKICGAWLGLGRLEGVTSGGLQAPKPCKGRNLSKKALALNQSDFNHLSVCAA